MADLKAFTRELMDDMAGDLGTRLDWVAVDHWNTDNPHIHVLVRGVDETGADLVIDRDYIREGMRARAEERSEEHTSELQSLMRISYAVFCLKNKNKQKHQPIQITQIR